MSDIADYIGLKSLLLCNESFASTNEREGSQIACGVIDAFTAARRHLPHDQGKGDETMQFDVTIEISKGQRNKYQSDHDTSRIQTRPLPVHVDGLPHRLRLHRRHAR